MSCLLQKIFLSYQLKHLAKKLFTFAAPSHVVEVFFDLDPVRAPRISDTPAFAVPHSKLNAVSDHPAEQARLRAPKRRMILLQALFLISFASILFPLALIAKHLIYQWPGFIYYVMVSEQLADSPKRRYQLYSAAVAVLFVSIVQELYCISCYLSVSSELSCRYQETSIKTSPVRPFTNRIRRISIKPFF